MHGTGRRAARRTFLSRESVAAARKKRKKKEEVIFGSGNRWCTQPIQGRGSAFLFRSAAPAPGKLFNESCCLSGQRLPAVDDHVDEMRVELHAAGGATVLLTGNNCCSTPGKEIKNDITLGGAVLN